MRFSLILLICLLWISPARANEGAGLLSGDLDGALPKDLWEDQPRSKIIEALQKLSVTSPYKSVQAIKRDMLLSTYDVSDIEDDVPPSPENNLLTLRLHKLMDMGLWKDALTFYNKVVEDPEDNQLLAETGVTLVLLEKGLSTACLDAKALMPRYSGEFWTQIDAICKAELYGDKPIRTQLGDSSILKALYLEPNFTVAADNFTAFDKMTFLEAAITRDKERIQYKNIDQDVFTQKIPPKIKALLTGDSSAPDSLKNKLAPEKEETTSETEEIKENEVSQSNTIKEIATKLEQGESLSFKNTENLKDFAELYPENYFYLEILEIISTKYGNNSPSKDKINLGMQKLVKKHHNNVKLLNSLLDKRAEFSNNRREVYEKQKGIILLSVLHELRVPYSHNAGENSMDNVDTPLNRLRNVGLIQQSHLIAKEILANLMAIEKKEN